MLQIKLCQDIVPIGGKSDMGTNIWTRLVKKVDLFPLIMSLT